MDLDEKVRAVEQVFDDLDKAIASFQTRSKLTCNWGCGKCCFKPDIEASVLEFLPFAYHLYHANKAEEWLTRLEATPELCVILDPRQNGAGLCSQYRHRGLICRLFGYSARTNKYGAKELVTCTIIKTEQADLFAAASEAVSAGADVPVMNQYYMRLHAIDFAMAQEFFPVNQAIKRAIEAILHYYAYRSNI
jgi:uncharacterized protein